MAKEQETERAPNVPKVISAHKVQTDQLLVQLALTKTLFQNLL